MIGIHSIGIHSFVLPKITNGVRNHIRNVQRADQGGRIRQRRTDAVGALGDRGLDVLDHDVGVVVARTPDDGHAEVGGRSLSATLHDGPERAVVGVGDDVERQVRALREIDRLGRIFLEIVERLGGAWRVELGLGGVEFARCVFCIRPTKLAQATSSYYATSFRLGF